MSPETSEPPITVAELIDRYMTGYHGRDGSLPSRLAFWRDLLGSMPVADVRPKHVSEGLKALRDAPSLSFQGRDAFGKPIFKSRGKRSAATLNRYLAALGGCFTWAMREWLVPEDWDSPCKRRLRQQGESRGRVRFLSDEERTALLAACRRSKWPRLYLMVLMALTTGARRGELLGLRWSDVNLARQEARVAISKNDDPKVLPLVPAVLEELQALRKQDVSRFKIAAPTQFIFHSPRAPHGPYEFTIPWRDALQAAKVRNFRFHDLRHSCASYLAQSGASLLEIGDVLGHRTLSVTKRYSHLTTATKAALVARVLGDIR